MIYVCSKTEWYFMWEREEGASVAWHDSLFQTLEAILRQWWSRKLLRESSWELLAEQPKWGVLINSFFTVLGFADSIRVPWVFCIFVYIHYFEFQLNFEYFQSWRFHNFPGQLVAGFHHPHCDKNFSDILKIDIGIIFPSYISKK